MPNRSCGAQNQAGFTLIEMLVVIAVLGVVIGALAALGPPRDRWLRTEAAAARVAGAMHQDSGRAIATGRPVPFALPALPAWLLVAEQAPPGGIVFQPDGSASGGIVVLEENGRQIAISADWLTGRINVHAS